MGPSTNDEKHSKVARSAIIAEEAATQAHRPSVSSVVHTVSVNGVSTQVARGYRYLIAAGCWTSNVENRFSFLEPVHEHGVRANYFLIYNLLDADSLNGQHVVPISLIAAELFLYKKSLPRSRDSQTEWIVQVINTIFHVNVSSSAVSCAR